MMDTQLGLSTSAEFDWVSPRSGSITATKTSALAKIAFHSKLHMKLPRICHGHSYSGGCGVMLKIRMRPLGCRFRRSSRRFDPKPCHIKRREEQQSQHSANDDAAHHGERHWAPENLPCNRNKRQTGRSGGQHDWAHAMFRCFHHGLPYRTAGLFQVLDLDNQDDRV